MTPGCGVVSEEDMGDVKQKRDEDIPHKAEDA